MLAIPEREWMPRCNATYKLNIRFEDWSPESGLKSYSHPFTSQVDTFTHGPFTRNCHSRRLGLNVHTRPDDFFLNGLLAAERKGPQRPDSFPFVIEYGYHFDSGLLGEYLSEVAVDRGATHVQARIVEARTDESGALTTLVADDGVEHAADFFVDCTGFASVLMGKTLGVGFKSFADNLFNDSAVVMPTPREGTLPAETVAYAMQCGWRWKIPLTHRFGNGYVYSSDFISHDDAEAEFRASLGMLDSDTEARRLRMRVGQLEQHWHRNCLGLGLSQGFIEPLEATALHLVQISIELFMTLYEKGQFSDEHARTYNEKIDARFERVRDYIVAHYKLNTRDDTDYWKANRANMTLSNSLRHILDVWYRRGDLNQEIQRQKIESHFGTASWHCLLAGYGAFPPLAGEQPEGRDLYEKQSVRDFLAGCSLNFAAHEDNLAALDTGS